MAEEYLENARKFHTSMVVRLDHGKDIVMQKIDEILKKLNKGIIRRYISENDVLEVKYRIKDLKLGMENYFAKKVADMNEDLEDIENNTQEVKKFYNKAAAAADATSDVDAKK
jgi:uncharacterized phage infection (PIP) family protein YhgE